MGFSSRDNSAEDIFRDNSSADICDISAADIFRDISAEDIFRDSSAVDPFCDGIMKLFDNGISDNGSGSGDVLSSSCSSPDDPLPLPLPPPGELKRAVPLLPLGLPPMSLKSLCKGRCRDKNGKKVDKREGVDMCHKEFQRERVAMRTMYNERGWRMKVLPSHSSQFDAFVAIFLHPVQNLPCTESMSTGGSNDTA